MAILGEDFSRRARLDAAVREVRRTGPWEVHRRGIGRPFANGRHVGQDEDWFFTDDLVVRVDTVDAIKREYLRRSREASEIRLRAAHLAVLRWND